MANSDIISGLGVIQALKNLGKDHIDDIARARVKRFLNGTKAAELKKNLKYAPQWVRALVFSIMEDAK